MKRTGYARIWMLVALLGLAAAAEGWASGQSQSSSTTGTRPAVSTLRVGLLSIANLDPALISSDPSIMIDDSIYNYLVDITPQNTIVGDLAKSWKVSGGGTVYTFRLQHGVTFHDGSKFTAKDVVWTFNRLRNPKNGFATESLYSDIAGISATGPHTVVFTLKHPNPFFLNDLSDNHALILKAGTKNPATSFNGTGPFEVVSYSPGDRMVLAADKHYFVPGLPKMRRLEIIFFSNSTAEINALRGGQVDLVLGFSTDLYQELQHVRNITTYKVTTNAFDAIRLRTDRKPGNNPLVIEALKLATDRRAIYKLVLHGYGTIGSDTPIGPMYQQYYDPIVKPLPYDPQKARRLLAEAGYGGGLDLTVYTLNTSDAPALAQVLKSEWAKVGVNLTIKLEPESVYYGQNKWLNVNLGITGWGSRPYPQFYFDVMLECGAKWNSTRYCNPELDRLANLAGSTLDQTARVAAYDKLQSLLAAHGPMIIPYFFDEFAAMSDKFTGLHLMPFYGRTELAAIRPVGRG